MISGNIHEKSNLAILPEPLQRAVQFLKDNDLAAHEPGKFELDGDKMILQVIDQSTGARETLRPCREAEAPRPPPRERRGLRRPRHPEPDEGRQRIARRAPRNRSDGRQIAGRQNQQLLSQNL